MFLREDTRGELWEATVPAPASSPSSPWASASSSPRSWPPIALRFRWTFTPITAFTGFLYTIPSVALFGVLRSRYGSFVAAEVALISYTLLVLVRNMVAGIDGVPGVGHRRRRRARAQPRAAGSCTVELPARPAGDRRRASGSPRSPPSGWSGITAIIQLGGLGQLIFDGYGTQYYTKIVVGSVLSIGLAVRARPRASTGSRCSSPRGPGGGRRA